MDARFIISVIISILSVASCWRFSLRSKNATYLGTHGDCFMFKSSASLNVPQYYDSVKVTVNKTDYLRIWGCPEFPERCEPKIVPSLKLQCMVCKGRCAYGGETYRKGASITGFGGSVECKCEDNGVLTCGEEKKLEPTAATIEDLCM